MTNQIRIKQVALYAVTMRLISPFKTSLATIEDRNLTIIKVTDQDGVSGWGECVAFDTPWYTEETQTTCLYMMKQFLIPLLMQNSFTHPADVADRFRVVRKNPMAKAGLEAAVWDLYGQRIHKPLASMIGGTRAKIDAGISIGLQQSESDLIETIDIAVKAGYKRVKIKINRDVPLSLFDRIRTVFPSLPLIVDANAAFSLGDIHYLQALAPYNLLMIEQPLATDSFVDYARLQAKLATPICLDETIQSLTDAINALEIGACRVINIKPARVGGLTEAIQIHDYCYKRQIPVWCGGMLESGVSRALNIALASLPNFTIPGDISSSSRYWQADITSRPVEVSDGQIEVPLDGSGLGFDIDENRLKHHTVAMEIVSS